VIEKNHRIGLGPVAQTFFMDEEIAEQYLLDSILTLENAKHATGNPTNGQERQRQVGLAVTRSSSKENQTWCQQMTCRH
jgi:G3E family GTPase